MDAQPVRLAIVYDHPLLGEGVGRMLALEPDLDIEFVEAGNRGRVDAAIDSRPDMVLIERSSGIDALEVLRRTPDSLVIEVTIGPGPTLVYRRQEISGETEAVLGLVRRLRGGHPTVAVHEPAPDPVLERRLAAIAAR
jgi:DNA-binding NarL/FixJ family response regulator